MFDAIRDSPDGGLMFLIICILLVGVFLLAVITFFLYQHFAGERQRKLELNMNITDLLKQATQQAGIPHQDGVSQAIIGTARSAAETAGVLTQNLQALALLQAQGKQTQQMETVIGQVESVIEQTQQGLINNRAQFTAQHGLTPPTQATQPQVEAANQDPPAQPEAHQETPVVEPETPKKELPSLTDDEAKQLILLTPHLKAIAVNGGKTVLDFNRSTISTELAKAILPKLDEGDVGLTNVEVQRLKAFLEQKCSQ